MIRCIVCQEVAFGTVVTSIMVDSPYLRNPEHYATEIGFCKLCTARLVDGERLVASIEFGDEE